MNLQVPSVFDSLDSLMSVTWIRVGALTCFLAVALGAFGAHALKETLQAHHSREIWNTAVLYQFLHGLAVLFLAFFLRNRGPACLFIAGVFLFSGSLYLLSLTEAKWLGPITPLGGLCFLAGWIWLLVVPR